MLSFNCLNPSYNHISIKSITLVSQTNKCLIKEVKFDVYKLKKFLQKSRFKTCAYDDLIKLTKFKARLLIK